MRDGSSSTFSDDSGGHGLPRPAVSYMGHSPANTQTSRHCHEGAPRAAKERRKDLALSAPPLSDVEGERHSINAPDSFATEAAEPKKSRPSLLCPQLSVSLKRADSALFHIYLHVPIDLSRKPVITVNPLGCE